MSSRRFAGGGSGVSSTVLAQLRKSYTFKANGNISIYTVSAAAPTGGGGPSFFDGVFSIGITRTITEVRLTQREVGQAGTTTVDLYRSRGGVWTLLVSVAVVVGQGNLANTNGVPAGALATLLLGDSLGARFQTVQTAGAAVPMDVVLEVVV